MNPTIAPSTCAQQYDAITSALEPRLQLQVARRAHRTTGSTAGTTRGDVVRVLARVMDTAAWVSNPDVSAARVVGAARRGADGADRGSVVIGHVPVIALERVAAAVASLEAAILGYALSSRHPKAPVAQRSEVLPAGARCDGARGVLVGVVDRGCAFAHSRLLTATGRTRVIALWDQNGPLSSAPSRVPYGAEYLAPALDAALGRDDPFAALGYDPHALTPADAAAHGTHVLDVAGGHGAPRPGIAPNADLAFVDLAEGVPVPGSAPDSAATRSSHALADSACLLDAVGYIFSVAGARGQPCVVNVSIGTHGGPHDGSSLVEEGIDALARARPGRGVVIAAGNSNRLGAGRSVHTTVRVPQGQCVELGWRVPPAAGAPTTDGAAIDLWCAGSDRISVALVAPDGTQAGPVDPSQSMTLRTPEGELAAFITHRLQAPDNGQNQIAVFLSARMPAGTYQVRLTGVEIADGRVHAWIERNDKAQSTFRGWPDAAVTLSSIACGRDTIVVGALAGSEVMAESGAGPTRDGRPKPDLVAPGANIRAACSRSGSTEVRSGTSQSAAIVTGVAALVLAEAQARGVTLTSDELRHILVSTAIRSPLMPTAWDRRWGAGRVSAANAIAAVIARYPD